jgi:hypothetical protein
VTKKRGFNLFSIFSSDFLGREGETSDMEREMSYDERWHSYYVENLKEKRQRRNRPTVALF